MSFPVYLLAGGVTCLGVVILTIVLLFIALKRGSSVISQGLKERAEEDGQSIDPANADNRFARGDLKSSPPPPDVGIALDACPACGGENPRGAGVCAFCGRKL